MTNPPDPTGDGRPILQPVSAGSSGNVFLLAPDLVVKLGHLGWPHHVEHEHKVYEALGLHPRIVEYLGTWNDINRSAVLRYHPRGCLRQVLQRAADNEVPVPRRKWAVQLAEALVFIHSKGVVHGDINASNVLVTDHDDVLLCDFAGAALNGEPPVVACYEIRHFRPRSNDDEWASRSEADDLFALGSLLFELYTGEKPFKDKEENEVEKLYKRGIFADTSSIPAEVEAVINGCWTEKYKNALELLQDVSRLATS